MATKYSDLTNTEKVNNTYHSQGRRQIMPRHYSSE
jgi:hypothetical protein